MMMRRIAVLLCACAVLRSAHSAAVTTPDTFVVSKDDGASSSPPSDALATSAPSTEGPLPSVKLSEMSVESVVSLRYAHTAVVTRVRNPASRAQETTFRVLLPETAFISGFVMTLGGKSYKAYVKEKEEAKQIYNEAVSHGIGAAHIATKARDSNHFTVSVNVEANSEAVFNVTYEELLTRRAGVYNLAVNLHPGALVPRLTLTVRIHETNTINTLRVPEVRTGNEIDADEHDAQNKKAVIVKSSDGKGATITFTPDLDEQKRLMEVYAQKSKESRDRVHTHWYNRQDDDDPKAQEGVLGQFVVQYDVDRPKGGEIMVNDGYFVHFFAPSSLPPLNKHVVFVLDTSGSMMDRKIEQLRDAMTSILEELNPGDYFSIVEFSSDVTVHDLKEADEEEKKVSGGYYFDYTEKPVTLVPPSEVNEDNIKKAKIIVKRLHADGGTNIGRALEIATQLISKGINWTPSSSPGNTTSETITPLPLTAGNTTEQTATESPPSEINTDNKPKTVIETEETQRLVPIIIFLTDGEPTVGTTDTKKIISTLSEQNYGYNKAAIYSLAFGEDADRQFLRKLSLRNEGFMRHIYEAADAALQLRHFYREVSSPLLADVKFTYPTDQVKEESVTKRKFRTFYAESETIVAGRIAEEATELSADISGFCGVEDGVGRKKYRISPKIPVPRNSSVFFPLERMWAYLTIKQLLDERDAADDDVTPDDNKNATDASNSATDDKTPAKKALEIALKYEFVTPLTSLVVVKPNASNTVDAESVDKTQDDVLGNVYGGLPSAYQPLSSRSGGGMQFLTRRHFMSANSITDAFRSDDTLDSGNGGASFLSAPMYGAGPLAYEALEESEVLYTDFQDGSLWSASNSLPASYSMPASYSWPVSQDLSGPPQASGFSGFSSKAYAYKAPSPVIDDIVNVVFPSTTAHYSGAPGSAPVQDLVLPENSVSASPVAPSSESPPQGESSVLSVYGLSQFPWIEPAVNTTTDQITFQQHNMEHSGPTVVLKLARQPATVDAESSECSKSVSGGSGQCVYLPRCTAAQNITLSQYQTIYCTTKQGFAGVCCPADGISTV